MKKVSYYLFILLTISILLSGCSTESAENDSSIIIDLNSITTSQTEIGNVSDTSINYEVSSVTKVDVVFNEDKVHYYDGYMNYEEIMAVIPDFHVVYSGQFDAYDNAQPDDWFVIGIHRPQESISADELREILDRVGALEIKDHPFLEGDYYTKLANTKNDEEKASITTEKYSRMYPKLNLEENPEPFIPPVLYEYVGYVTRPMIEELAKAFGEVSVSYTFMPEIGNHDSWLAEGSKLEPAS